MCAQAKAQFGGRSSFREADPVGLGEERPGRGRSGGLGLCARPSRSPGRRFRDPRKLLSAFGRRTPTQPNKASRLPRLAENREAGPREMPQQTGFGTPTPVVRGAGHSFPILISCARLHSSLGPKPSALSPPLRSRGRDRRAAALPASARATSTIGDSAPTDPSVRSGAFSGGALHAAGNAGPGLGVALQTGARSPVLSPRSLCALKRSPGPWRGAPGALELYRRGH